MSDKTDASKPKVTGWYWFLPDEKCPTPTGLLRVDKPVVVLVGSDNFHRAENSRLVVRFSNAMLYVDDMSGDWELIKEPKRMTDESIRRIKKKLGGT